MAGIPPNVRSTDDIVDEVLGAEGGGEDENQAVLEDDLDFTRTPFAIKGYLRGRRLDVPEGNRFGRDPKMFLESVEEKIKSRLTDDLQELDGVKFQIALKVRLTKDTADGRVEFTSPVFRNNQGVVTDASGISEAVGDVVPKIEGIIDKWTQRGSGWTVDKVETLWIDTAKYQPLKGGSYIELQEEVSNKKAVINVKNNDDECLRWSLRAALFPTSKDPQRPNKYPINDGLNFTGIDAPTPIAQIKKVE